MYPKALLKLFINSSSFSWILYSIGFLYLKIYMVDRLKTSFTGESQSYEPVIMENDKLM